jgi:hypothetical protein
VNSVETVLKLGWLGERRDFSLLKATHKAIYSQYWLKHTTVEVYKPTRTLRSNTTLNLVRPGENGTFQDISSALFNTLPNNIKVMSNFNLFCSEVEAFLKKRYTNTT